MLKFLKTILGRTPKKTIALSLDQIPGLLEEREKEAHDIFTAQTDEQIRNIRDGIASLQLVVNDLKVAEQDPETHPKIKSIARNSLPLFVKAMNASLAREFPEDAEEFYTAVADCLKICLNSLYGQGRYLQAVFPQEMKAINAGIDTIGREVNAMTGALTRYKNDKDAVHVARKTLTTLTEIQKELNKADDKERRTRSRIDEIDSRIREITAEIDRILHNSSLKSLDEQKERCSSLVKQREELLRSHASLSMTAAHIFRKAEKIAIRKHLSKEKNALKIAIDVLSDHEIADGQKIMSTLAVACPLAQAMVEAGELPLKNKDERAMFADMDKFCSEITVLSARYRDLSAECQTVEQSLASHPVLVRTNALEREKAHLVTMRLREEEQQQELGGWREKTVASIPELRDALIKKLEEMIGETVQLQADKPAVVEG
jgi:CRISPR/Cas system CMR-associated protein Cmr5 small subunit